MDSYPYYENLDYVEKIGQWTILEWLNEAHFRLYFPDRTGRLRLVAINNHADKDYRVLAEDTLWNEFDVTYCDLNFTVGDGAQNATTLDDRCTWPAALYPDGPPRHTPQQEKLPGLTDLPLHSRADAWI
jgi:hypothetical protein